MGFWPTGPVTLSFAVIVFTVAAGLFLWGNKSHRLVAFALIISWIGARTATVTGNQWIYVAFLTLSAALSFAGITLISRLIAMLYAMRIALVAGLQMGLFTWFVLWELNLVLLAIQLILAAGGMVGGRRKCLASHTNIGRFPVNNGDVLVARSDIKRTNKGSISGDSAAI